MSAPSSPAEEILWREAVWAELQSHPMWPDLPPEVLRAVQRLPLVLHGPGVRPRIRSRTHTADDLG